MPVVLRHTALLISSSYTRVGAEDNLLSFPTTWGSATVLVEETLSHIASKSSPDVVISLFSVRISDDVRSFNLRACRLHLARRRRKLRGTDKRRRSIQQIVSNTTTPMAISPFSVLMKFPILLKERSASMSSRRLR